MALKLLFINLFIEKKKNQFIQISPRIYDFLLKLKFILRIHKKLIILKYKDLSNNCYGP
jgi:hypothetical protein